MTDRRAWLGCAVAGVMAFVASFLFGRVSGLTPCGQSGGLGAVLAFEFARAPADVAALFGAEPCRAGLVAAQRTALLLDGLWFIPAYTGFLVLAARASGGLWWRWLGAALLVAGLSDEVEGLLLWAVLDRLPGTDGLMAALWWPVHVKFALLATGTAGIGALLTAHRWRVLPRVIGIGLIVMGGFALLRLIQGEVAGMMLAFTLGWTALLLAAVAGAVRPSLFAGRAAPPPGPVPPVA